MPAQGMRNRICKAFGLCPSVPDGHVPVDFFVETSCRDPRVNGWSVNGWPVYSWPIYSWNDGSTKGFADIAVALDAQQYPP